MNHQHWNLCRDLKQKCEQSHTASNNAFTVLIQTEKAVLGKSCDGEEFLNNIMGLYGLFKLKSLMNP